MVHDSLVALIMFALLVCAWYINGPTPGEQFGLLGSIKIVFRLTSASHATSSSSVSS